MDVSLAGHRLSARLAVFSIAGFWLFFVCLSTTRSLVINPWPDQPRLFLLRLIVGTGSAAITLILFLLIRRFDAARLSRRIVAAALSCGPGALAVAMLNAAVYRNQPPCGQPVAAAATASSPGFAVMADPACDESWFVLVAEHSITGYFLVATWAALYLALSYAAEVGHWERRTAELRAAAQTAELRALRYQINPHFLFNTLNSLSTLVLARQPEEAEQMILHLSAYFRASLAFDPTADVSLGEEFALQRLYLEIEARRFPRRLRVETDLPPFLADARVPGMILQPLVENAVKHGVARSRVVTTVRIAARAEHERLLIEVSDDAAARTDIIPGTGIGLRNVADRLLARYGHDAKSRSEASDTGGFVVTLDLPLTYDAR